MSSIELESGLPHGQWSQLFDLPRKLNAFDLKIDSHGRLYVSDPSANHVYQFHSSGKILLTYGRHDSQTPGQYDEQTFMSPSKLATWTDRDGNDRLLIVEAAGPNRASEWSGDGKLLREFLSLQTHANDGYAVDTDHVDQLYILGHKGMADAIQSRLCPPDVDRRCGLAQRRHRSAGAGLRSPCFRSPQRPRLFGLHAQLQHLPS